jgi:hypothetical protein
VRPDFTTRRGAMMRSPWLVQETETRKQQPRQNYSLDPVFDLDFAVVLVLNQISFEQNSLKVWEDAVTFITLPSVIQGDLSHDIVGSERR